MRMCDQTLDWYCTNVQNTVFVLDTYFRPGLEPEVPNIWAKYCADCNDNDFSVLLVHYWSILLVQFKNFDTVEE